MNFKNVCIILTGVSGSGKSTFSKFLGEINFSGTTVTCSADDYHVNDDGEYVFDAANLSLAHKECYEKAEYAMEHGANLVIIDNTNIRGKDRKQYIKLATKYGYMLFNPIIQNVNGTKNVHDVPEHVLEHQEKSLRENLKLR